MITTTMEILKLCQKIYSSGSKMVLNTEMDINVQLLQKLSRVLTRKQKFIFFREQGKPSFLRLIVKKENRSFEQVYVRYKFVDKYYSACSFMFLRELYSNFGFCYINTNGNFRLVCKLPEIVKYFNNMTNDLLYLCLITLNYQKKISSQLILFPYLCIFCTQPVQLICLEK